MGSFRAVSLRNVGLRHSFMHNGRFQTLEEVVDFYDRGGNSNPLLDPLMTPLYLSEADKRALVAFMRALTGSNVQQLAAQARAAASTPTASAGVMFGS